MQPFKHILVPTDFGDASNRALEVAASLATKFNSKLTLLHTYAAPPAGAGSVTDLPSPVDESTRVAKRELDSALGSAKDRYSRVEGLLTCGEPWREIINAARTCDADLIVMGTHGRHWLARALLGSVAEEVVRLSPIPVVTVPSIAEQRMKEEGLAEIAARCSPTPESAVGEIAGELSGDIFGRTSGLPSAKSSSTLGASGVGAMAAAVFDMEGECAAIRDAERDDEEGVVATGTN